MKLYLHEARLDDKTQQDDTEESRGDDVQVTKRDNR